MAKIVYFVDTLCIETSPLAYSACQLIEISATTNHEVYVISADQGEDVFEFTNSKIQVLRPFNKLRPWEAHRILPILVNLQPDIIHFMFCREENPWPKFHAFNFVRSFSSLLTQPLTCISLFALKTKKLKQKEQELAQTFDLIFIGNKEAFESVNFSADRKFVYIDTIIPPAKNNLSANTQVIDQNYFYFSCTLSELRQKYGHLDFLEEFLTRNPTWNLVFGKGWGSSSQYLRQFYLNQWATQGLSEKIKIFSHLTNQQDKTLLEFSRAALFIERANDKSNIFKLKQADSTGKVCFVTQKLHNEYRLYFSDRKSNYKIISDRIEALFESLHVFAQRDDWSTARPTFVPHHYSTEEQDETGNILNRSYSLALGEKA